MVNAVNCRSQWNCCVKVMFRCWTSHATCVFSDKVAPGVDGGNIVCATGAASTSFGARVVPSVSAARR